MAIVPLPLPPDAEARTLLHHILEHGDIVGKAPPAGPSSNLAVDDWTLEKLLTFDADGTDLEDGGDDEPDADAERDGPPVLLDMVRLRVMRQMQVRAFGQVA